MIRFLVLEAILLSTCAWLVARGLPHPIGEYGAELAWARDRGRDAWRGASRRYRAAFILVAITALVLRIAHLQQPIRYDEAWTWLHYASQPLRVVLSDYSLPNNHIFHSLLAWLTTRLFGNEPWALRLPAMIAGCAAVVMVYVVALELSNPRAALIAMAIAGCTPVLVLFSTNARGYMLIVLAFLVLVQLACALLRRDRPHLWLLFAVVTALGLYTAPVMMYPAAAVLGFMLFEQARFGGSVAVRRMMPRMLVTIGIAAFATIALYLPVLLRVGGTAAVTSNRFVTALRWHDMPSALVAFFAALRPTLELGIGSVASAVFLGAVLVSFAVADANRERRVSLALALLAACALLILVTRRPPPARVLLFVVPLCSVLAAVGIDAVGSMAGLLDGGAETITLAASALAIMVLASPIALRHVVADSDETDWLGLRDGLPVADWLMHHSQPGDRIVVSGTEPSLDYYLRIRGGTSLRALGGDPSALRLLLVVNEGHGQTPLALLRGRSRFAFANLPAPRVLARFRMTAIYAVQVPAQSGLIATDLTRATSGK